MVKVEDCLNLKLPGQVLLCDRYFAEAGYALGVAVYIVGKSDFFSLQFFPRVQPDIEGDFINHVLAVAKGWEPTEDQVTRRALYPYREAPDILTLSCIITDHCETWRQECASTERP